MNPATYKLLITGSMGAGKTSAISAVSEIPTVCTDTPILMDQTIGSKTTTTVAMDYGEVQLDDHHKVAVFGTPGQRRYDFMCRILAENALGVLILIDQTSPEPVSELAYYLDLYRDLVDAGAVVVGVTHCEEDPTLNRYYDHLASEQRCLPVFTLDARERSQVHSMLATLLATVEATQWGSEIGGEVPSHAS